MKKHSFIAIICTIAVPVCLSSCSVLSTTCPTTDVNYPAFVSELEIDTAHPVTASATAVRIGALTFGPKKFAEFAPISIVGADRVKSAVLYKAIEGTDYDVIVGPSYETSVKNYLIWSVYKTSLTGFGGKIVGMHKLSAEEVAANLNPFSESFKVARANTEPISVESEKEETAESSKPSSVEKPASETKPSSVKETFEKVKNSVETKANEIKTERAEKSAEKAAAEKSNETTETVEAAGSNIHDLYSHAVKCIKNGDTDTAVKDYEQAQVIAKSLGTLSEEDETTMSRWDSYMKAITNSKKRK